MADVHQGAQQRFWSILSTLILVALVGATALFAFWLLVKPQGHTLKVGAGPQNSEAFELMSAVADVAKRHSDDLEIVVVETAGSQDSIQRIEDGDLDLVVVSADIVTRPTLTLVAPLYPAVFHLLVRRDSDIYAINQLIGHNVALPPPASAQFRSFWFLIGHYDISPESLWGVPMSTHDALAAIVKGEVEAVFRMRAPRNKEIRWLIESANLRLIPIDQGNAMKLRRAAIETTSIPKGAYAGHPAVPSGALPTVASRRLLLARADAPEEAIRTLTSVLFERRRDLLLLTKLAGFIEQPDLERGTFVPVHPGALSFYTREQPSVLEEKAELLAFVLSALLVTFSGLIWLKRRWDASQKGRVDRHNNELIRLCDEARATRSLEELAACKERMVALLKKVVEDLDYDRVAGEGFQYFAFTWEAVNASILDHERSLKAAAGRTPARAKRATRGKQAAKPSSA